MKTFYPIFIFICLLIINTGCKKDDQPDLTGSIEITVDKDWKYYLYTESTFLAYINDEGYINSNYLESCDCALKRGTIVKGETLEISDLNHGTYYFSLMPVDSNFEGDIGLHISVVQVTAGKKRSY